MAKSKEERLKCSISGVAGIDSDTGVVRGVTVAKAGVPAIGKFILLDADGNMTADPEKARQRLQVVTDNETLDTIMGAAQDAGGRLKVREDHDDSIGSRAGYIDNFRLVADPEAGNRITGDLHLFDSYRNRRVAMETIAKTPDQIGLSIDMIPSFEIRGKEAFMRVKELMAVDLVDAGAITPAGLFCSASVDKTAKDKEPIDPHPITPMAKEQESDIMTAIKALSEHVTKCNDSIAEMASKLAAKDAPPAKKTDDSDKDGMSAIKTEFQTQLAAIKNEFLGTLAEMKKEQAALGLKITKASDTTGGEQAAEAERMRLAAEKEKNTPKDYSMLVKEFRADPKNSKMNAQTAHNTVQKANPDVYASHLLKLGVVEKK